MYFLKVLVICLGLAAADAAFDSERDVDQNSGHIGVSVVKTKDQQAKSGGKKDAGFGLGRRGFYEPLPCCSAASLCWGGKCITKSRYKSMTYMAKNAKQVLSDSACCRVAEKEEAKEEEAKEEETKEEETKEEETKEEETKEEEKGEKTEEKKEEKKEEMKEEKKEEMKEEKKEEKQEEKKKEKNEENSGDAGDDGPHVDTDSDVDSGSGRIRKKTVKSTKTSTS